MSRRLARSIFQFALFVSTVAGTIAITPQVLEVLGLKKDPPVPPVPPDPPKESACPLSFTVDATEIHTSSMHADVVEGDSEVDSDDWTSVELSYEIRQSSRDVKLVLVWSVQERNKDKSKGDTKVQSRATVPLFDLPEDSCVPFTIARIEGAQLTGQNEKYYSGQRHGQQRFPNTGSLKNINVTFDQKGNQDKRVQALNATFDAFSVRTRKN